MTTDNTPSHLNQPKSILTVQMNAMRSKREDYTLIYNNLWEEYLFERNDTIPITGISPITGKNYNRQEDPHNIM